MTCRGAAGRRLRKGRCDRGSDEVARFKKDVVQVEVKVTISSSLPRVTWRLRTHTGVATVGPDDAAGIEVELMLTSESCKVRLERYLREQGVEYEFQHHPLAYTARGVAASEHLSPAHMAKTVIVVAGGQFCMVVLPASHDLQLTDLAREMGVQARLAVEAEFEPMFPDCEVGAMPPFGNLYGLPVLVDASLAESESIVFEAGTYTDTMRVRYGDFARLTNARVVRAARDRELASEWSDTTCLPPEV
jgi:Ala-tRNA(Pro) deacylase